MFKYFNRNLNYNHSNLLVNKKLNLSLASDGYITFPFLNTSEIEILKDIYYTTHSENPKKFYASTHSPDFHFRRKISDQLTSVINSELSKHLINFRLLGAAFVVKPPLGHANLEPHQDWNLVDETIARSFNLWIPLVDVNSNNGAMYVLPKSHFKLPAFRGPNISSLLKDFHSLIWKNMNVINMTAGEALLYDHALIHASRANRSNSIRIGIVFGIIPKNADMLLYFNNNDNIQAYHCDPNFFLSHNPQDCPQVLEKISSQTFENRKLYLSEFKKIYLKNSFIDIFSNLLMKLKAK
jgi:hypothetical protein